MLHCFNKETHQSPSCTVLQNNFEVKHVKHSYEQQLTRPHARVITKLSNTELDYLQD